MNVLFVLKALWVVVSTPFCRVHTANICGHTTLQNGFMNNGHKTSVMEMPLSENGHPDYCLDCIGKMSICCAWCGKSITIGSPITLYIPNKNFKIPDYAVKYGDGDTPALVGCLRWECADAGDLCGFWMPPGAVERVPSPIELSLQACLNGGSGVVVVDDLRNYPAQASIGHTK